VAKNAVSVDGDQAMQYKQRRYCDDLAADHDSL